MKTIEDQEEKPMLYLGESKDNGLAIKLMKEAEIPFRLARDEFNYPYVVYNRLKFEGIEEIRFFIERYPYGRFD